MTKTEVAYHCQACGALSRKWMGQCADCGEWNTLTERLVEKAAKMTHNKGYAGQQSKVMAIQEVVLQSMPRTSTQSSELDRVLGGGLVPGAVVLIGGDPGIGKSTLLLQTAMTLSQSHKVLYVTGEESVQQVAMRGARLGLPDNKLLLLAETSLEKILQAAHQTAPDMMVIDSIQTMYTEEIQSAPGGVSQVRECAAHFARFAKQNQTAVFLVGHVTKSGEVAGPRVLEHIVDTVIYLEGQSDNRFRLLRALKNRFGAANELGLFAMTDKGMKPVSSPSAMFLSGTNEQLMPGSVILGIWEGTRPLIVELQALVDTSYGPNPRRVAVGLDLQRMTMLLAVLHRHGGIATHDQDVFINVVGGMRIQETSADLAILLAIRSSLKNKAMASKTLIFGEVGLSGEIRPVQRGLERLKEAAKHGLTRAIVPKANLPKINLPDITVQGVSTLSEALNLMNES